MVTKENNQEEILCIAFNQDQGCFACGTETGFRIFNSYPFKETFSRDLQGGIGIIEMLYRCNILALVGGGKNPKYPTNKVMLWDDHQIKAIGEMSFRSEVKAVKLMSHRVVVVLDNKIFVYQFSDLKLIDHIETCPNPKGLCALNTEVESTVLACPDKLPGHVIIHLYDKKKTTNIKAHQSSLSSLELNARGTKLATASEKGTIIRIYSTEEGKILQELRRGSEYAQIYSLTFDPTGRWIACSSDSGTIHIFSLKLSDKEKEEIEDKEIKGAGNTNSEPQNPKSKFSFMKVVLPYFDSEWSFAQFRVPDMKTKVAFGPDPNTIIVASYEGNYYLASLNPSTGGECTKTEEYKLFNNAKTL